METKMTKEEILKHVKIANDLSYQKSLIENNAMMGIREVLESCENRTLSFSDKEDDDENFTINVLDENILVDSIELLESGGIALHTNENDYHIWETDTSHTQVYCYIMDEIQYEMEANNEQ